MPMTQQDNDRLTRVENGAPMGKMLRQWHWLPAVPSLSLEAGEAPIRVRLLGDNYVVFRSDDGRVACFDEQCPHRKASLAVARNEDNALTCLFHGWKFSVSGEMIEAPNHTGDQVSFCQKVKFNSYKVQEAGGIVWVWLGEGETPPAFPELPFTTLPENQRAVACQEIPTNWVQGVEASMDTSHVGVLHSSSTELTSGKSQRMHMTKVRAPRLEFEEVTYGFRYAALRPISEEEQYVRVNNFVMPWYGIICPPEEDGPGTVFFSVPVDDTHHRAWFVHFNTSRPLGVTPFTIGSDLMDFPPLPPGDETNNWGQDRGVMARGHFTGFPQHFGTEDFAIFLGQGPIVDRTTEQLCSADGAVLRVRNLLLRAAQDHESGKPALSGEELKYAKIRSVGGILPEAQDWRVLVDSE